MNNNQLTADFQCKGNGKQKTIEQHGQKTEGYQLTTIHGENILQE